MSATSHKARKLQNLEILVACSAKKMIELAAGLESMGASILPFPVIEVRSIEDKHLIDEAIRSLRKYDWLIFTSAHGVDFFMQRLNERGLGVQNLPKICAVGPATAAGLKKFGGKADLIPEQYVAEGVLAALVTYHGGTQHLTGLNILLPRAEEAREFLPMALTEAGANVDIVPCYRTVRAEIDPRIIRKIREKRPDLLVFTSSSTINNLVEILGPDFGRKTLMESTVAVIGPITAGTAADLGKRADIIPKENTIAALLEAIDEYYSSQKSEVRSQE